MIVPDAVKMVQRPQNQNYMLESSGHGLSATYPAYLSSRGSQLSNFNQDYCYDGIGETARGHLKGTHPSEPSTLNISFRRSSFSLCLTMRLVPLSTSNTTQSIVERKISSSFALIADSRIPSAPVATHVACTPMHSGASALEKVRWLLSSTTASPPNVSGTTICSHTTP
jgi:hypothetical protein